MTTHSPWLPQHIFHAAAEQCVTIQLPDQVPWRCCALSALSAELSVSEDYFNLVASPPSLSN